jgi:hypothetical protein
LFWNNQDLHLPIFRSSKQINFFVPSPLDNTFFRKRDRVFSEMVDMGNAEAATMRTSIPLLLLTNVGTDIQIIICLACMLLRFGTTHHPSELRSNPTKMLRAFGGGI